MKKTGRLFILSNFLILISVISSPAVYAGEEGVRIYTLDESIETALENNWSIKAGEEKILESEFAEKEAKADFYPEFSTNYSYTRVSDVTTIGTIEMGDHNNYQLQATVTQPLFTGYALTSSYELAKLGIDASEISLELEKLELALSVKEAYFNILKADKSVEVEKSSVESLEAHLAVAHNFYNVGMTAVNDLLEAEVELANARYDLIKAQNDARLARMSFNILLSKPVDDAFEVDDILVYNPEAPNFEELLDKALKYRPEIKALDISDSQADQQIKLAKSSYYPEAAFSYSYIKAGDTPAVSGSDFQEANSWQAYVGLSWTFWDWDKTKNSVRQAESQKRQLSHARKTMEDGIRLELKEAILSLKEAEEKIPTAEKAVEQAEENLRVSKQRYKAQVTTSTEVLDAETLLLQARMNYYSALYDHNLARAMLLKAVGEY